MTACANSTFSAAMNASCGMSTCPGFCRASASRAHEPEGLSANAAAKKLDRRGIVIARGDK
jgi:hypothetical protein